MLSPPAGFLVASKAGTSSRSKAGVFVLDIKCLFKSALTTEKSSETASIY